MSAGSVDVLVSFRALSRKLIKLGFRRTYRSRSRKLGGMVEYRKGLCDRQLDLQLWADGKHRISHWVKGQMNTAPTEFETIEQMLAAIDTESTRGDNQAFKRGAP